MKNRYQTGPIVAHAQQCGNIADLFYKVVIKVPHQPFDRFKQGIIGARDLQKPFVRLKTHLRTAGFDNGCLWRCCTELR